MILNHICNSSVIILAAGYYITGGEKITNIYLRMFFGLVILYYEKFDIILFLPWLLHYQLFNRIYIIHNYIAKGDWVPSEYDLPH